MSNDGVTAQCDHGCVKLLTMSEWKTVPENVAGLQIIDWLRLTDRALAEWSLLCPPIPRWSWRGAHDYLGQALGEEPGQKVQLCHRTGNGSYHLIEVSVTPNLLTARTATARLMRRFLAAPEGYSTPGAA